MSRVFMAITLIFLFGCTSEDPHPEVKDPIYKDLKAHVDAHLKDIEDANKRLVDLRANLEKTEANSIEQKDVRRDIAKNEAIVRDGQKWAKYYKIRAERRAVVDKITAREAASAGEPWPNPREYSDYQVNKRLREAPLNWNKRVPKLQDRLPKKKTEEDLEKEAAAEPAATPAR